MANVSFTGNVVRPDLKFSGAGQAYYTFSVAENHRRKNRDSGQYEESGTTWWRVTFFGNKLFTPEALAEAVGDGASVLVEGRSESREYEKDGEKRTSLEVVANNVGIMPKAPKDGTPRQQPAGATQGAQWGGNQQAPAQWGNQPQNGQQWGQPAPF